MYLMKRYNLFLPTPMIAELKARSEATGFSVSEMIRQALIPFLENPHGKRVYDTPHQESNRGKHGDE